ncbi:MAG: hypothetical protein J5879_10115, partial [Clostridia bacterium]|nr:hypothetical protein [Clostridia bacterium]
MKRILSAVIVIAMIASAISTIFFATYQPGYQEDVQAAWKYVTHVSYDEIREGILCGATAANIDTPTVASGTTSVKYWGWIGAKKTISGFSYSVSGGETVTDPSFLVAAEAAVAEAAAGTGATSSSRFGVVVPVSEGSQRVRVFVDYSDNTSELIWQSILTVGDPTPVLETTEDVLREAYALSNGKYLVDKNTKFTLNGVVTSVDTVYNERFGNVTVTMAVDGFPEYPIQCYRLQDAEGVEGADKIGVGYRITVRGALKRYNADTVQFDAKCELLDYVYEGVPAVKDPDTWLCKEGGPLNTGWWMHPFTSKDWVCSCTFETPNAFDGFIGGFFANPEGATVMIDLLDEDGDQIDTVQHTQYGDGTPTIKFSSAYTPGKYTIRFRSTDSGSHFVLGSSDAGDIDVTVSGNCNTNENTLAAPVILLTGAVDPGPGSPGTEPDETEPESTETAPQEPGTVVHTSADQVLAGSDGHDLASFGSNDVSGTELGLISESTITAWGWCAADKKISEFGYRYGGSVTLGSVKYYGADSDIIASQAALFGCPDGESVRFRINIPVTSGQDVEVFAVVKLEDGTVADMWRIVYSTETETEPDVTVPETTEEEISLDTSEGILRAAYALGNGKYLVDSGTQFTLTGVISSVDTAYNEKFGNVTVTMIVDGLTDYPIRCYRMKNGEGVEGIDRIGVGYTITVRGAIKRYNASTVQFDDKCELIGFSYEEETTVTDPPVTEEKDPDTWLCREGGALATGWWMNPFDEREWVINCTFETPNAFDGFVAYFYANNEGATVLVELYDDYGDLIETLEHTQYGNGTSTIKFSKAYAPGMYTISFRSTDSGEHFVLASGDEGDISVDVDGNALTNGDTLAAPVIMLTGAVDPGSGQSGTETEISYPFDQIINIAVDGGETPVEAEPGQEVTLKIRITNNAGISSLRSVISWSDKLTLTDAFYDIYDPEDRSAMKHEPRPDDESDPLWDTVSSPYIFNWLTPSTMITGDCTFATLTFRVAEDAVPGSFLPVELDIDPRDVFIVSGNNIYEIAFEASGGGVTVTVPPHEHVYGKEHVIKAPTCTEDGEAEKICTVCGESYKYTLPKTGHTQGGYEYDEDGHYHVCATCGERLDSAEHEYGEENITKAPTCTEEGEAERVCTVCGYVHKYAVGKADHVPGGYEYDEDGHYHVCAMCGERIDSAGHEYGEEDITKAPTCTEEGEAER